MTTLQAIKKLEEWRRINGNRDWGINSSKADNSLLAFCALRVNNRIVEMECGSTIAEAIAKALAKCN